MKNGSASDDLTPTISAEDKDSILLGILEGSYSVQEACRRHGLAEKEIERWGGGQDGDRLRPRYSSYGAFARA